MATLSRAISRLGSATVLNNVTRTLPATSQGLRLISGKAMRIKEDKPKPWNYEKWQYTLFWSVFDKTSLRFDENSKMIVVEGAHAIGKTDFAKELAEELDMLYVPAPTMDDFYVNKAGVDLRDYRDLIHPRIAPFDDKDFLRDPMGPVPGSCDRYMFRYFMMKYITYVKALRHIFNTGQGVVTEGSPYSFKVNIDAAYNAGWIDRSSMKEYELLRANSLFRILRPNLVIYLDAPVDVVRRNIKARGNEWDQNSPVWNNTQYLNDLYNTMKRDYLKNARKHSQVLVYNWEEKGETEVVVEDIERLNLDYFDLYEEQQKDWRLLTEDDYASVRYRYTSSKGLQKTLNVDITDNFRSPHMIHEAEEVKSLNNVVYWLKGSQFRAGYDPEVGDNVLMKMSNYPKMLDDPYGWGSYEYTRPLGTPSLT